MNPITCIAIDDEPMALLVIEQFCRRKGGISLTTFSEPRTGMEEIRRCKPDLVFLDIRMNSISGIDVANTLPRESCFVFTTAYAEYAIEGFNMDAVDFLYKPFSYERFETAVEKVMRRLAGRRSSLSGSIIVKQEYNNVSIPLSDIIYIEALGNYVKIFRKSTLPVLTRINLKTVLGMLPRGEFLRIHRSYLVAIKEVESFTKTNIVLKNSSKILPVGAQYVANVMNVLGG